MILYISQHALTHKVFTKYNEHIQSPNVSRVFNGYGISYEDLYPRILMSYAHNKNNNIESYLTNRFGGLDNMRVMADSGAFTAYYSGDPIKIEEYRDWVYKWGHLFDMYATFDVLRDPIRSWQNYEKLRRWGLRPLPVFHQGSPMSYLERYIECNNFVGLSRAQRKSHANAHKWVTECMARAERTNAVYHGFGITSPQLLRNMPWFTIDSSSWNTGLRYGFIAIFSLEKKEMYRVKFGSKDLLSNHDINQAIRFCGFNPRKIYEHRPGAPLVTDTAREISCLNLLAYQLMIGHLNNNLRLDITRDRLAEIKDYLKIQETKCLQLHVKRTELKLAKTIREAAEYVKSVVSGEQREQKIINSQAQNEQVQQQTQQIEQASAATQSKNAGEQEAQRRSAVNKKSASTHTQNLNAAQSKTSALTNAQAPIPINNIFTTIQGEGEQTGLPIVMLRLQGCGVGCVFCDTKETWKLKPEDELELIDNSDKVFAKNNSYANLNTRTNS